MKTAEIGRGAVLSLGRIYADLVFNGLEAMPQLGRELFARDFELTPGGGALITAAHLVARSRPAALVARYGTDPIARALEEQLAGPGIDLQFLERHESAGPQVTVVMVRDAERAFLSRRAAHAVPGTVARALAWPRATHLHIAEYATLYEMPDIVTRAKAAGLSVSLDPSWDDKLIGDPAYLERCQGVDLFLPNLEEGRALTGLEEPGAIALALSDNFPVVALKCGAEGGLLASGGTLVRRGAPKVTVVDTTGAGDAFNAGFIDAWLDGSALPDCLDAAIDSGSRSVQATGGTGSLGARLADYLGA